MPIATIKISTFYLKLKKQKKYLEKTEKLLQCIMEETNRGWGGEAAG